MNLGAIYKSAFANKWGVQYLEQKELLAKTQDKKKRTSTAKRKQEPALIEHAQDQGAKLQLQWDGLQNELKSEYLKRALNNIPKGVKSATAKDVTTANVMDRPLLWAEIEKLLVSASAPE